MEPESTPLEKRGKSFSKSSLSGSTSVDLRERTEQSICWWDFPSSPIFRQRFGASKTSQGKQRINPIILTTMEAEVTGVHGLTCEACSQLIRIPVNLAPQKGNKNYFSRETLKSWTPGPHVRWDPYHSHTSGDSYENGIGNSVWDFGCFTNEGGSPEVFAWNWSGPTAFFKPPLRSKRHGKTESDGLGLQRLSDKAMSTFHSSKGGWVEMI